MKVIPGSNVVQAEDVEKLIICYDRQIGNTRPQSSISEYVCTVQLKDGRSLTKNLSSFDTGRIFKDIGESRTSCREDFYARHLKEDLTYIIKMNSSSIEKRITGDILTTIFNDPKSKVTKPLSCVIQ